MTWREKQVYIFTTWSGVGGEAGGEASPGSLGTSPLLQHKHAIHLKAHSFRFLNCCHKDCFPLLLLRRLIIMPLASPHSDVPPHNPQHFTYPAPCPLCPPHSPLPPHGPLAADKTFLRLPASLRLHPLFHPRLHFSPHPGDPATITLH